MKQEIIKDEFNNIWGLTNKDYETICEKEIAYTKTFRYKILKYFKKLYRKFIGNFKDTQTTPNIIAYTTDNKGNVVQCDIHYTINLP